MGRNKQDKTALRPGDCVLVMHLGPCIVKEVYADGLLLLEKGSFWGGATTFKEYSSRCIKMKGLSKQIVKAMYISKKMKFL